MPVAKPDPILRQYLAKQGLGTREIATFLPQDCLEAERFDDRGIIGGKQSALHRQRLLVQARGRDDIAAFV